MTYIICAFESEARALIDKYKLAKDTSGTFTLFKNEEFIIFICGMGQENAQTATQNLLLNFPNKENDIFVNLGICAAQTSYNIGTLVQIHKLQGNHESHVLKTVDSGIPPVSCFSSFTPLNRPVNEDIAEMEALSLYTNISPYFKTTKISFLKVVSDNFNPVKFNKGFIISLMNANLSHIIKHINIMKEKN